MAVIKKNHRRMQSAMEYLMTYSWSILMIAIILGALFALGTFGTNTYRGTACTVTSGYFCTNPILNSTGNLSVTFGEEGYPITVTGLGCTNSTAMPQSTATESPSISFQPGEEQQLVFECPIPSGALGSTFTGDLWIVYSQGAQSGLYARIATISAKVSTTSAVTPAYIGYVPITVTNSQGSGTPAPFQQMIAINPSSYGQYLNSNLGNIRFYSGSPNTGAPLYSWCESGCSSSASMAVFWVSLPNGIGAGQNIPINMVFEKTSINYDGTYAGEAPTESTSYGKYDNGASVFTFYDNFKGTTLSSQWNTGYTYTLGTYSVNNGLTLSYPSGYGSSTIHLITKSQFAPAVLEVMVTSSSYSTVSFDEQLPTAPGCGEWYSAYACQVNNDEINLEAYIACYTIAEYRNVPNNLVEAGSIYSCIWAGTGNEKLATGYNVVAQATDSIVSFGNSYIDLSAFSGSTNSYQWVRLRAYPPGDTMPDVSLGSLH